MKTLSTKQFEKWLGSVKDVRARAAIGSRVARAELGNFGDAKSVGDGVAEMRIHLSPGIRVYYHVQKDVLLLLLAGGNKGSQDADIAAAKRLLKEWSEQDG